MFVFLMIIVSFMAARLTILAVDNMQMLGVPLNYVLDFFKNILRPSCLFLFVA